MRDISLINNGLRVSSGSPFHSLSPVTRKKVARTPRALRIWAVRKWLKYPSSKVTAISGIPRGTRATPLVWSGVWQLNHLLGDASSKAMSAGPFSHQLAIDETEGYVAPDGAVLYQQYQECSFRPSGPSFSV